jgi:SAM-dependent methyltransferase/uncharacterized protein YbaR (Trm112 family)
MARQPGRKVGPSKEISMDLISGRLADVLACPVCGSPFAPEAGPALTCRDAGHAFPVTDGIAQLAVESAAGDWSVAGAPQTSEAYARQYEDAGEAAKYNAMYGGRAAKRATTRRESRLIRQHLASQPACETILDLPCGGGRLSPAIAAAAPDALIIEADIGLGQVRYARDHGLGDGRQAFITASGFHVPVRDDGVDAVVCVRLFHHLPAAAEQERLLGELLRVARRFVILTFFDYYSVKNTLRRARSRFNGKPPKITMKPEWLRDQARARGAELIAMPHLFWLSSGHRYALLHKRGAD